MTIERLIMFFDIHRLLKGVLPKTKPLEANCKGPKRCATCGSCVVCVGVCVLCYTSEFTHGTADCY